MACTHVCCVLCIVYVLCCNGIWPIYMCVVYVCMYCVVTAYGLYTCVLCIVYVLCYNGICVLCIVCMYCVVTAYGLYICVLCMCVCIVL